MNVEKYRALFVDEAADHLAEMSRALTALEQPDAHASMGDAIDTLFRMAHSIKGMASSLDYDSVATLAHRFEDWLEPMRTRGMLPDESLPLLYEVIGALEQMVATVEQTGAPPAPRQDLLERLALPVEVDPPAPKGGGPGKKGRISPLRRSRAASGSGSRRSIAS